METEVHRLKREAKASFLAGYWVGAVCSFTPNFDLDKHDPEYMEGYREGRKLWEEEQARKAKRWGH